MSDYFLRRTVSNDKATLGVLSKDGKSLCLTCEEPWRANRPRESCIPAGRYLCRAFSGQKYKNVWQVCNVPGRSAILIHNGNTTKDTEGCILVGRNFGIIGGLPAVTESIATLEMLRKTLPKEFWLTILDRSPE